MLTYAAQLCFARPRGLVKVALLGLRPHFAAFRFAKPHKLTLGSQARQALSSQQAACVTLMVWAAAIHISEISFNEENLSLIREICLNVLWFEKYIVNDGTPNNMRGESINITPARNKDGIVITCITQ